MFVCIIKRRKNSRKYSKNKTNILLLFVEMRSKEFRYHFANQRIGIILKPYPNLIQHIFIFSVTYPPIQRKYYFLITIFFVTIASK